MANSIITTGKVLHQIVIGQLQGISEDQFDIQANGFNNTIRWNVGHIVYWMDRYSTLSFGLPTAIPPVYETLFGTGTKPSEWTIAPPSKAELTELLMTQLSRMSELTPEMLNMNLHSPFIMGPFGFVTSGELFNFALMHEAIHLGIFTSQHKTMQL
ncbi:MULTISPECIES: DinB family protein [Paenibacillus]|uniref:Formate dehydrogenase n=1 Tax=Paenibacillus albilobatus TaxID=2716884 RepID=A0A920CDD9_9BACL|nr:MULTISPECIES: DinB family protein [Paenibacillus]GIO32712.1 formate dehydrogenase [Paenibacillus albilobatus]